jgi:hypothetical protein
MRVLLHATNITQESLQTAKATIEGLGNTIVFHRQESRPKGGMIAHLVVEGEPAAIRGILNLVPAEQLEGFTEFGPATTKTGNVACRVAIPGDDVGILLIFSEVAPEVPTRVYPHTLGRIEDLVGTGLSWVAVDADDNIVGYALAYSHDNTVYLDYLGVSKTARGQLISGTLVSKLKESGAPIIAGVRPDNKSSMVERFKRFDFVEIPNNFPGTKLRWERADQA